MKYKQKPVVVDAVQWNGQNVLEIKRFIGDKKIRLRCNALTIVPDNLALETTDWLVKYSDTQFVVFKDNVFDGYFTPATQKAAKETSDTKPSIPA